MRILVVNDDGIFAPGIKHLAEIAAQFGEVLVVSPLTPQSGQSHAVTLSEPLRLNEHETKNNIRYFSCSGTPVDCVKLAIKVVYKGELPDYVFSGINHGSNASSNAIYSGTVAGAIEAALTGIPTVAFSLTDHSLNADFSHFLPYVKEIIATCIASKKKNICWNVNCPKAADGALKGIKVCRSARAFWNEDALERIDPSHRKYYWLEGDFVTEDAGEDTDLYYLDRGYISLTPLHFDWTDYRELEQLKKDGLF